MLKNNKGFMLIEVVVTAAVIMTVMIALYASFNKLYNNYKTRNSYYNLDAEYATKEMIVSMLQKDTGNINTFIKNKIASGSYGYLINDTSCDAENTPTGCDLIRDLYGIHNMLVAKYNKDSLNNLKTDVANQTFKDYIDYIITYYDVENTGGEYSYIVLTEIENDNNNYYANLRMR